MEIIMAIVIGIIFTAAIYLILSKSILRIILGTGLISHGAHLLLLTMGGFSGNAPPVISEGLLSSDYVDPLPQALILTAIVISFGVTAFILVVAYRSYQEIGSDSMEMMKGTDEHE